MVGSPAQLVVRKRRVKRGLLWRWKPLAPG